MASFQGEAKLLNHRNFLCSVMRNMEHKTVSSLHYGLIQSAWSGLLFHILICTGEITPKDDVSRESLDPIN